MDVNDRLLKLTNLALTANAAWHDELRDALQEQLVSHLARSAGIGPLGELILSVLDQFHKPLASTLADARLAAWVTGAGSLAAELGKLPYAGTSISWPGDDLWQPYVKTPTKQLADSGLMTPQNWELINELYRQAADKAAREQLAAAGDKLKTALVTSWPQEGAPDVGDMVTTALDTSQVGEGIMGQIFHSNVYSGHGQGQDYVASHPDVPEDQWPYVTNLGIPDSRQTDLCYAIDNGGLDSTPVYRYDDPVWQHFRPLRHYGCRCAARMLTIAEAAERGVREARRWLATGQPPDSPQYVAWPDVRLPPGWIPGGGL